MGTHIDIEGLTRITLTCRNVDIDFDVTFTNGTKRHIRDTEQYLNDTKRHIIKPVFALMTLSTPTAKGHLCSLAHPANLNRVTYQPL